MQFPEYCFVGCKHDLKTKTEIVLEAALEPAGEFYVSMLRFKESITALPSLSSVPKSEVFFADYLIIDLDKKDNITFEDVTKEAVEFSSSLKNANVVFHMFFSGSKGYHIYIPTCQFKFEPTSDEGILERMAKAMAGEYISFDSTIYNVSRVIRYPFSYHPNGSQKVWGSFDDKGVFIPINWGSGKAYEGISWINTHRDGLPVNSSLLRLYEACKAPVLRAIQDNRTDWDGSLFPTTTGEGGRNNALYRLARKLAVRAIPQTDATWMALKWNEDQPNPMTKDEVESTVKKAYLKGHNQFVDEATYPEHSYDIKKALNATYKEFNADVSNSFFTGYDFLDKLTMGIQRQEAIYWIARPGLYKTAVLSNILMRGSKITDKVCIIFSQEMSVPALSVRHIQLAEGMSKKDVLKALKDGKRFTNTEEQFSKVVVVGMSRLNTNRIVGFLDHFLTVYGHIGCIGIDYLGLMDGCANHTQNTAKQAAEFKNTILKAGNCPGIMLVQANRDYEGDRGNIELDRIAGKDAGMIEESADYMFGHWRYFTKDASGLEIPYVFGRALKTRGFDSEEFEPEPYFGIEMEPDTMTLRNFHYAKRSTLELNQIKFRQKGKNDL